jgi:hypothetical protein
MKTFFGFRGSPSIGSPMVYSSMKNAQPQPNRMTGEWVNKIGLLIDL